MTARHPETGRQRADSERDARLQAEALVRELEEELARRDRES